MSDNPIVEIYRAKNGLQAHLFVTALEEAGIRASYQGRALHPESGTAESVFSDTAVWWDAPRILVRAEDADMARAFLLELEAQGGEGSQEAPWNSPIEVVCEKCASLTSFPASQWGSIQPCPQCGDQLDVAEEDFLEGAEEEEDSFDGEEQDHADLEST